MAEPDKKPVTLQELLVSSLAQTDALAKLLIEKGLITREEFMQKISEARDVSEATESDSAIERCCRRRRRPMRCILEKSIRRFLWRIRTLTLIISVVLVFGSTSVFARGGGHGGGHS